MKMVMAQVLLRMRKATNWIECLSLSLWDTFWLLPDIPAAPNQTCTWGNLEEGLKIVDLLFRMSEVLNDDDWKIKKSPWRWKSFDKTFVCNRLAVWMEALTSWRLICHKTPSPHNSLTSTQDPWIIGGEPCKRNKVFNEDQFFQCTYNYMFRPGFRRASTSWIHVGESISH